MNELIHQVISIAHDVSCLASNKDWKLQLDVLRQLGKHAWMVRRYVFCTWCKDIRQRWGQ